MSAGAASQMLKAALAYLERGWSVLPCVGKSPAIKWATLQVERAPMSHVHEWARRGWLQNVGVICGSVSDNLVVIDLDGRDAVNEFSRQFPHLLSTRQIVSGSGNGMHIYLRCQSLPPTTRTSDTPYGGFELRADGCYVIAPPSIHPKTRQPYHLLTTPEVLEVDQLDDVVAFIRQFQKAKEQPKAQEQPPQPQIVRTGRGWRPPQQLYLESALEGERRRVLHSSEGSRNDSLNKAAFYLGKLIHAGLDRPTVEAELLAAALAVGLDEVPSRRTIKSGLDAGIKKARPIPTERKYG